MDDVGSEGADEGEEFVGAADVGGGVYFADEVGDGVGGDGCAAGRAEVLDAIEEGTLGSVDGTEGEVDIVAAGGLTFTGEDGVLLRTAEDEACGDVEDAEWHR